MRKFSEIVNLLPEEKKDEARKWQKNLKLTLALLVGVCAGGMIGMYFYILNSGCHP